MKTVLETITTTLDDKQAHDITVIDFKQENSMCDYFVVCDAPSFRQINALADSVIKELEENGFKLRAVERQATSSWILVDAYDVIVHIFLEEDRAHYNLEKLYQDYVTDIVL